MIWKSTHPLAQKINIGSNLARPLYLSWAYPLPAGGTVMRALLANASHDTWRVEATRAPYSARTILKARGYRWDPAAKVWWTEVKDGAIEAEELWLFRHVLPDGPSPRLVSMTWHQRHR